MVKKKKKVQPGAKWRKQLDEYKARLDSILSDINGREKGSWGRLESIENRVYDMGLRQEELQSNCANFVASIIAAKKKKRQNAR